MGVSQKLGLFDWVFQIRVFGLWNIQKLSSLICEFSETWVLRVGFFQKLGFFKLGVKIEYNFEELSDWVYGVIDEESVFLCKCSWITFRIGER